MPCARSLSVVIVTDAWKPQTNGVVTTLDHTGEALRHMGHRVQFITPVSFRTVPLPTYPSIRLALRPQRAVRRMLEEHAPDAVHIATEGPLGLAARRWCLRECMGFTTSYHTQFPQYVRLRLPIPLGVSYAYLRWFHGPAARTMVPTASQQQELRSHGFRNVVLWGRGVDTGLFRPYGKDFLGDPRPISMYVGRVAVEKNIEAFLNLELPGTKYVVGDGPDHQQLARRHPQVRFTGFKYGETLARHLAAADVFVFPSRTDTFGLVLLEAMACGVPVAAYPVTGPVDVVTDGVTGALDADLGLAVARALQLKSDTVRAHTLGRSWEAATRQFLEHLEVQPARPAPEPGLTN
ncbi:MAG: glycosyltransferase family 1 protein [Gammaproteobacteria bacterium]